MSRSFDKLPKDVISFSEESQISSFPSKGYIGDSSFLSTLKAIDTPPLFRYNKTMEQKKIRAIVTKENFFGESDKYISVFAKDEGKISLLCKGAKKQTSPFLAITDPFIYGDFIYEKSKRNNYLKSVDVIESFPKIREDILKLAYANFFAELINRSFAENVAGNDVMLLLLRCLKFMNSSQNHPSSTACVFILKFLKYMGYMPELYHCCVCGSDSVEDVYTPYGLVCKKHSHSGVLLPERSGDFLRYILENNTPAVLKTNFKESLQLEKALLLSLRTHIGEEMVSYKFIEKVDMR